MDLSFPLTYPLPREILHRSCFSGQIVQHTTKMYSAPIRTLFHETYKAFNLNLFTFSPFTPLPRRSISLTSS